MRQEYLPEASVLARTESILCAAEIPILGSFDLRGLAVDKLRTLTLEAAQTDCFTLHATSSGEMYQTAPVVGDTDVDNGVVGEIWLAYKKGSFSGMGISLSGRDDQRYFVDTAAQIFQARNDDWRPIGRLRSRLLYSRISSYRLASNL